MRAPAVHPPEGESLHLVRRQFCAGLFRRPASQLQRALLPPPRAVGAAATGVGLALSDGATMFAFKRKVVDGGAGEGGAAPDNSNN